MWTTETLGAASMRWAVVARPEGERYLGGALRYLGGALRYLGGALRYLGGALRYFGRTTARPLCASVRAVVEGL